MTRTPSPQPSPPDRWRSEREEMERLMRQRSGGEGAKISSTGMGASSSPPHLLIRADASDVIGVGHVMRMIALAQAWQKRGGTVTVASCHCPEPLVARLQREHIQFTKLTLRNQVTPTMLPRRPNLRLRPTRRPSFWTVTNLTSTTKPAYNARLARCLLSTIIAIAKAINVI